MPAITPTATGTDRNRAAFAALALAAARQATTFVFICDAQLRPCFLNRAGREMLGLLGRRRYRGVTRSPAFFTLKHRPIVETVALPAVLRDGRWEGELCFRHFTESSRETEVRWSAFALRDEVGELIGAAAFTIDISRHHRAEGAVRDQEFGLAADEMLGKTFADLDYPAGLADRLNGHIDRVLKGGVTVKDEVFYRSPTRYAAHFDFLLGPVRGGDG